MSQTANMRTARNRFTVQFLNLLKKELKKKKVLCQTREEIQSLPFLRLLLCHRFRGITNNLCRESCDDKK